MIGFHDELFPLSFALGSSGGPQRRTDVTSLSSGREFRTSLWSGSRRRWDVGGGVVTLDQLAALTAFFEARRGRLHGFRFRDATDWKSCLPSETITAQDQEVGRGDAQTTLFPLVKRYGTGAHVFERPITHPVAVSVVVSIDGIATDGWRIDAGMIHFDLPPALDAVIAAGFAFDIPVRFDTDQMQITIETVEAGRAISVPLIEIQP